MTSYELRDIPLNEVLLLPVNHFLDLHRDLGIELCNEYLLGQYAEIKPAYTNVVNDVYTFFNKKPLESEPLKKFTNGIDDLAANVFPIIHKQAFNHKSNERFGVYLFIDGEYKGLQICQLYMGQPTIPPFDADEETLIKWVPPSLVKIKAQRNLISLLRHELEKMKKHNSIQRKKTHRNEELKKYYPGLW